ncbi:Flavodoxin-like domain-containing protein [Entamoeba marina]
MKPLVIYYSSFGGMTGEAAHKMALYVHGDIYEIKTPKLYYHYKLARDGNKKTSKIPIVFDVIDFSTYDPIYICGETSSKRVIGPVRSWMHQNKNSLILEKKELIYVVYGKRPSKALSSMKDILGEPKDTICIDRFEYPLDMQMYFQKTNPIEKKKGFKTKVGQFFH